MGCTASTEALSIPNSPRDVFRSVIQSENLSEELEQMVSANLDVNMKISHDTIGSCHPIHVAAYAGNLKALRILLEAGADVHLRDSKGQTALFLAISRSHIDIVEELVQAKSDVNIESVEGITPLLLAIEVSTPTIVEILLQKGADATKRQELSLAVKQNKPDIILSLLQAKVDPNGVMVKCDDEDVDMWTWAENNNEIEILTELGRQPTPRIETQKQDDDKTLQKKESSQKLDNQLEKTSASGKANGNLESGDASDDKLTTDESLRKDSAMENGRKLSAKDNDRKDSAAESRKLSKAKSFKKTSPDSETGKDAKESEDKGDENSPKNKESDSSEGNGKIAQMVNHNENDKLDGLTNETKSPSPCNDTQGQNDSREVIETTFPATITDGTIISETKIVPAKSIREPTAKLREPTREPTAKTRDPVRELTAKTREPIRELTSKTSNASFESIRESGHESDPLKRETSGKSRENAGQMSAKKRNSISDATKESAIADAKTVLDTDRLNAENKKQTESENRSQLVNGTMDDSKGNIESSITNSDNAVTMNGSSSAPVTSSTDTSIGNDA